MVLKVLSGRSVAGAVFTVLLAVGVVGVMIDVASSAKAGLKSTSTAFGPVVVEKK